MEKEIFMKRNDKVVRVVNEKGPQGWVFFTAYIGAVVYFFNLDPTFWGFIVAVLKAAVWPAFVIHQVLGLLQVS